MPTSPTVILLIVGIIVLLLAITVRTNLLAKAVNTYETVVLGKDERTSVLFTGVFIPIVLHFLVIDGGEVKVERYIYNRIEVGDAVTVSLLSNGRYRLQGYGK